MAENKFNVGDKVKVINVGGVFSTYQEMAEIMDLRNWCENERPKNNSIAEIINVEKHPCFTEKTIYGIESENGKEYIMSEYALEKVEDNIKSKNETYSIKLKDMVELFTSYDKKEELLNEINPSDVIQISRKHLNEYYDYSDTEQQNFINNNFKIDGTTTVNAIIELEKISGNILKSWIRKNHPKYFLKSEFDFSNFAEKYGYHLTTEEEKEMLGFIYCPIVIKSNGKYKNKAFYLTEEVKWKLVEENDGSQTLVPIKK